MMDMILGIGAFALAIIIGMVIAEITGHGPFDGWLK